MLLLSSTSFNSYCYDSCFGIQDHVLIVVRARSDDLFILYYLPLPYLLLFR